MRLLDWLGRARRSTVRSVRVFIGDVGHGLLEVGHNTLALVGLVAVAVTAFGVSRPELRHHAESAALQWLQSRHEARELASGNTLATLAEPDAVARATALHIDSLPREQAEVAQWIARRYRVAVEPIAALVQEAWAMGQRAGVEPTLILAIMAIESSFNPFAQSPVGAQGLMQVLTRVHDEKYSAFGGKHAAFDPITNVRVGVQVLKECIARAGSVELGLRHYVGAALLETDGGYVARVIAEQGYLRAVAEGRRVPVTVQAAAATAAAAGGIRVALVGSGH
jgi:soluble lytic murein transglycosylase-like protein